MARELLSKSKAIASPYKERTQRTKTDGQNKTGARGQRHEKQSPAQHTGRTAGTEQAEPAGRTKQRNRIREPPATTSGAQRRNETTDTSKATTRAELQERQGSKPSPEPRNRNSPEFAKTEQAETSHQQRLGRLQLTKRKKSPIFVTRKKHKPKQKRTTAMNNKQRNTRPLSTKDIMRWAERELTRTDSDILGDMALEGIEEAERTVQLQKEQREQLSKMEPDELLDELDTANNTREKETCYTAWNSEHTSWNRIVADILDWREKNPDAEQDDPAPEEEQKLQHRTQETFLKSR